MIACSFGKTLHVAIVPLEQRRTVNSDWYTTVCLPVVFQEIRKTNCRRRITLHTSLQTTAFLSTHIIDLMSQPPYSSDLAPHDFFLFPYVKNKMRSQHFSLSEDAVDAFRIQYRYFQGNERNDDATFVPKSSFFKFLHNFANCFMCSRRGLVSSVSVY